MTKLTGAALDRAVAHVMGLKSVHNCEKWSGAMDETQPAQEPDDNAMRLEFVEHNAVNSRRHDNGQFIYGVEQEYQAWKQQRMASPLPAQEQPAQKTEREALKLALEVMQINLTLLEKIDPYKGQEDLLSDSLELTHEAIASIEAALEQPAQEPVACERCKQLEEQAYDLLGQLKVANLKWSVAHPWVGLTDEEIELIIEDCDYVALDVAPAIEQALKEKNNGA